MRFAVILAVSVLALSVSKPGLAQNAPPAAPAAAQQDAPASLAPLFCTVTAAQKCESGVCTKVDAFGDIKLPGKLLVHFDSRIVASSSPDGFPHVSQIGSLAKTGNDYVIQGVDHTLGWMIHLDEGGAKMTFTITSNAIVFTSAGTCKKAG